MNKDIPESVSRIIIKMMAKNPSMRYQDASELIDDLRNARRGKVAGPSTDSEILMAGGSQTSARVARPVGGAIAGGLLLIPFLIRAAGAGDVKYLCAGGLLVGFPAVLPMLLIASLAGLVLGAAMRISGALDGARVKHLFRCLFDWSYDRAEGRKTLPDREDEKARIPFGAAISVGIWTTLLLRLIGEYAR